MAGSVCVVLALHALSACNEFDLTVQEGDKPPMTAPEAEIRSPAPFSVMNWAYKSPLQGSVVDAQDLEQSLHATWTSSLDGQLATPTPTPTGGVDIGELDLSVGLHTLTLSVIDSDEMEGADEVDVEVCDLKSVGTLQVQTGGHVWVRIVAGEANATNELYLIEPDLELISLDVAEDQYVLKDLGFYEACTLLVFRLVTSIENATYDSNVDANFLIEPIEPNFWHIAIEDGADDDYNDILLDVWGGLADGEEPQVGPPPN
jgi:hypothetical protein